MLEELETNLVNIVPMLEVVGMNLLYAIVLLIVGWWLSAVLGRNLRKLASKSSHIDPTIVPMVYTVTVWAVRLFVILAVLARFGVQTASIIAVLGAAGLAIGLALQGTLQNIAAGIMLLALRPLRAGEFISVVGKADGTVDEVGLFLTRLIQVDGIHISLPNSLVWGSPIINYSRNKTRRMDIEVQVRYGDNLELALQQLDKLVKSLADVLADPAPQIMVTGYRESATVVTIRVWASVDKYWNLRYEFHRKALATLLDAGLHVPVPLREVKTIPPAPSVDLE